MKKIYQKSKKTFLMIIFAGLALGIAMTALMWKPAKALAPGEAGSGSVSSAFGAYSNSVGISVPGYYGMEPSIKLAYSSSAGNGLVGAGWNLGVSSYIERTSSTGRGVPKYNSSDTFLLDGEELLSNTSLGGTHVTQYQNYMRIKQDTVCNKWYIWDKSGTKSTYTSVSTTSKGTYLWALSEVEDTNGHKVYYYYYVHGNSVYLDYIKYGYNNQYYIEFYEEQRPDDQRTANGETFEYMYLRLKTIRIKVGSNIRSAYTLTYTTSPNTGCSLLTSVKQYGRDAVVDTAGNITSGTSYPAMTMSYMSGSEDFTIYTPGSAQEGDNYQDLLKGDSDSDNGGVNIIPGDYNGDGISDFIAQQKGDWDDNFLKTFRVYFGHTNGTFTMVQPGNEVSGDIYQDKLKADGATDDGGCNIITGDFDGDGRTDFMAQQKGTWCETDYDNTFAIYYSNGNGTFQRVKPGSEVSGDKYQDALRGTGNYLITGDFNGDGLTDFIKQQYGPWDNEYVNSFQVYLNNGNGARTATFTVVEPGSQVQYDPYQDSLRGDGSADDGGSNIYTGDFNGDRMTDFIGQQKGNWCDDDYNNNFRIFISNGNGTFTMIEPGNEVAGDQYQDHLREEPGVNIHVADFNGDGISDFIRQEKGDWDDDYNNSFRVYYGKGDGTFDIVQPGSNVDDDPYQDGLRADGSPGTYQGGSNIILSDFNNDGCMDFMAQQKGQWDDNYVNNIRMFFSNGNNGFTILTPGSAVAGDKYQDWLKYDNGCNIIPGDFNGDGKIDFIRQEKGARDDDYNNTFNVYYSKWENDLLTQISNGVGGTVSINYTPATTWPSSNALRGTSPFATVSSITVTDGRGNTGTTNYSYANDKYSPADRMYFGFAYHKATLNEKGTYIETNIRQTKASRGKVQSSYTKDSSGNIYAYSINTYSESGNGETTPYVSLPIAVDAYTKDLTANTQHTRETVIYDTYGNTKQSIDEGDVNKTGDELLKAFEYNYNTIDYIVSATKSEALYSGTSIVVGNKLTESRNYYDGASSLDIPPIKGNITRTEIWDDQAEGYISGMLTYDTYGNIISKTNGLGKTMSITYDPVYHQYVITATSEMGYTAATTYDYVLGAVISVTDANGAVTSTGYDALGRIISATDDNGVTTTTQYIDIGDPNNQHVRTTIPDGSADGLWSESYTDGLGRAYKVVKEGPNTGITYIQETVYVDTYDRVEKSSLWYANGDTPRWTTYEYDGLGRVIKTTHPDGTYNTLSYSIESSGESVVTATDELGNTGWSWQNAKGKTTRVREKNGTEYYDTYYTYDIQGRAIEVEDHYGNSIVSYEYSSLNRKLSMTDMNMGTITYTYDASGNLLTQTDAKGQVSTFTYDDLGRVLTSTVDGETTYTYYDESGHGASIGKLTRVVYPGGSESYTYNNLGQTTEITKIIGTVSKTVSNTYDTMGRTATVTYPDGEVVTYNYGDDGSLESMSGYVDSMEYNANGQLIYIEYSNGTMGSYEYDPDRLWLDTADVTYQGTTMLYQAEYGYNAGGLVTSMTQGTPTPLTTNYTYDDLGRLKSVSGAQTQSFSYNAIGNMTYNSRVGSYIYGDSAHPHAVTQAGSKTYTYDINSNILTGDGKSFTWDAQDRLTSVTAGSTVTTFAYGAGNERIKKTQGADTHLYFGKMLEVHNGITEQYYYAGPLLVAKKNLLGYKSWYHSDRLGSIRLMTNASGAEVRDYDYYAFGETLSTTGTANNERGFTGHITDAETGLIYMNARYYDPALCRFISADSLRQTTPQSMNSYSYCENNPINNTDPTGHSPVKLSKTWKQFPVYKDITSIITLYDSYTTTEVWYTKYYVCTKEILVGYSYQYVGQHGGVVAIPIYRYEPQYGKVRHERSKTIYYVSGYKTVTSRVFSHYVWKKVCDGVEVGPPNTSIVQGKTDEEKLKLKTSFTRGSSDNPWPNGCVFWYLSERDPDFEKRNGRNFLMAISLVLFLHGNFNGGISGASGLIANANNPKIDTREQTLTWVVDTGAGMLFQKYIDGKFVPVLQKSKFWGNPAGKNGLSKWGRGAYSGASSGFSVTKYYVRDFVRGDDLNQTWNKAASKQGFGTVMNILKTFIPGGTGGAPAVITTAIFGNIWNNLNDNEDFQQWQNDRVDDVWKFLISYDEH